MAPSLRGDSELILLPTRVTAVVSLVVTVSGGRVSALTNPCLSSCLLRRSFFCVHNAAHKLAYRPSNLRIETISGFTAEPLYAANGFSHLIGGTVRRCSQVPWLVLRLRHVVSLAPYVSVLKEAVYETGKPDRLLPRIFFFFFFFASAASHASGCAAVYCPRSPL